MITTTRLQACLCGFLAFLWLYAPGASADAAEKLLTLAASSGAKMRVLLTGEPRTASANLILLAGGDGRVIISGKGEVKRMGKNFLLRSRALFVAEGFLTAVVDAPFDRRKPPGLLGGFRTSRNHARDLGTVAAALRQLNGKPVAVIGTSRGATSAANLAVRQKPGTVHAAVLTSALAKGGKKGTAVGDVPLVNITIPVLFVHNARDACKAARLGDVRSIVTRMKKARVKTDLIVVESKAQKAPKACQALTPHGFLGIEKEVVAGIAKWIREKL